MAGTETGIFVSSGNLTLKDDILIGGKKSAIEFENHVYSYYADGTPKDQDYSGNVIFNPSFGKTITLAPCNSNFKEIDSFDDQAIIGDKSTLESCIITTPAGAEMKSWGLVLDGRPVKTKTIFKGITEYGVKVGSTQVTSVNASDVLGDGGHFKYNTSTNTLTVTNATFESTGYGIINEIDGLNVKFVGVSTFTTKYDAIKSEKVHQPYWRWQS